MSDQLAESTSESEWRPGPFYKEKKEALLDAGVTPKQYRHWREHGLFTPEKGKGSRYLTERDIQHLRFLRRLIVDFGLPITVVDQLLDRWNETDRDWGSSTGYRFLDLDRGELLSRYGVVDRALNDLKAEFSSGTHIDQWREWLMTLATVLFAQLAWDHRRNAAVYEAARDEVLVRLKDMDFVARVERTTYDTGYPAYRLSPSLPSDPGPHDVDWAELYEENERRLAGWEEVF